MNLSNHFVWTFWHSACRKSKSQNDPSGIGHFSASRGLGLSPLGNLGWVTCGSLLWSLALSCFSLSLSSMSSLSFLSLSVSLPRSLFSLFSLYWLLMRGARLWMESEWNLNEFWMQSDRIRLRLFHQKRAARIPKRYLSVLIGTCPDKFPVNWHSVLMYLVWISTGYLFLSSLSLSLCLALSSLPSLFSLLSLPSRSFFIRLLPDTCLKPSRYGIWR